MSVVFFIIVNNYVDCKYRTFFAQELNSNKNIVAHVLMPLYLSGNTSSIQNIVDEYGNLMNKRITVIEPDGRVIADSQTKADDMPNHGYRKEVKDALSQGEATNIRYSSTLNKEMLYTSSLIEIDGKSVAVLRLSMPLETINIFTNEIKIMILIIILIVLCISLIVASVIAFKISDKITRLKDASAKLAKGDFSVKINFESNDELDQLCNSFNLMVEKIKDLFAKTSEKKDRIDKIMESVTDTILVIDKTGRIIMHNSAFEKNFKNINPDNRFFWEIFRDKKVEKTLKDLSLGEAETLSSEAEYENKTYSFSAAKIKTNDTVVLTFHDITAIKQMALMKKEFVTNASHELKTPLTAISCFVENIESENDISTIKHYTSIIKKHTERLTKIVTDLLSLSELENNKNIEFSKTDLLKITDSVIDFYKNRTGQKKLKFEFIKNEGLFVINANEFYIEQMLMNLIDNAIRYTEEEGQITVKLKKQNDKINLTIEDTGIGIAPEHLPRLFERFYVVDKARSRKSGGTGLGLSIVKYIANIHGATITVDSKVNFGTSFTIEFNSII